MEKKITTMKLIRYGQQGTVFFLFMAGPLWFIMGFWSIPTGLEWCRMCTGKSSENNLATNYFFP